MEAIVDLHMENNISCITTAYVSMEDLKDPLRNNKT